MSGLTDLPHEIRQQILYDAIQDSRRPLQDWFFGGVVADEEMYMAERLSMIAWQTVHDMQSVAKRLRLEYEAKLAESTARCIAEHDLHATMNAERKLILSESNTEDAASLIHGEIRSLQFHRGHLGKEKRDRLEESQDRHMGWRHNYANFCKIERDLQVRLDARERLAGGAYTVTLRGVTFSSDLDLREFRPVVRERIRLLLDRARAPG